MKHHWALGVLGCVLASCSTPPPKPTLRFEPNGAHDWTMGPDGVWVARMHGADFALDLKTQQASAQFDQTRIQVTVHNRSAEPLVVRMGPEGTMTMNAIGEVLLRAIDAPPGQEGPAMLTYANMQRLTIEPNWRGIFYIDSPLGRDIGLGTYIVFTVEAHDKKGDIERRKMPLLATNVGGQPHSGG